MNFNQLSPVESQLRQLLEQRILILDGAMGTMIQQYKLTEADYRGERFADFKAPAGEREPVSYTHLDVYKRQHYYYLLF